MFGVFSISDCLMAILCRSWPTLQHTVLKGRAGEFQAAGMLFLVAEMWTLRSKSS